MMEKLQEGCKTGTKQSVFIEMVIAHKLQLLIPGEIENKIVEL